MIYGYPYLGMGAHNVILFIVGVNVMKISEAIAQRIKTILNEKCMTLYKLEKATTLSHSTITDLMGAKYNSPSFKNILLIINAFGMKTHEFFNDPVFDNENLDIL